MKLSTKSAKDQDLTFSQEMGPKMDLFEPKNRNIKKKLRDKRNRRSRGTGK